MKPFGADFFELQITNYELQIDRTGSEGVGAVMNRPPGEMLRLRIGCGEYESPCRRASNAPDRCGAWRWGKPPLIGEVSAQPTEGFTGRCASIGSYGHEWVLAVRDGKPVPYIFSTGASHTGLRTYSVDVGNGFIRSARKCGNAECMNAFPTGAGVVGRLAGEQCSCCGARRMSSATERLRPSPTTATRSGRFICRWQRSHRSPLHPPNVCRR